VRSTGYPQAPTPTTEQETAALARLAATDMVAWESAWRGLFGLAVASITKGRVSMQTYQEAHREWQAVKQGDGSLDAYLCMERKKFKALSNVCGYLRANPPSASQRGVLILQNVRSDYAEAFSAYLRREQLDAADVEYLQVCEWLQQYDSLSAKKFPWEKSAET
ncbi:hypothetical protein FOZ62_021382, partial [Perkinsus olseni]